MCRCCRNGCTTDTGFVREDTSGDTVSHGKLYHCKACQTTGNLSCAECTLYNGHDCCGRTIDRTPEISRAIKETLSGKKQELEYEKNGRNYDLCINKIVEKDEVIGVLLLAIDNTEKIQAEQNRREFTANVSHELKTPLQSIIGSADLYQAWHSGFSNRRDCQGETYRSALNGTKQCLAECLSVHVRDNIPVGTIKQNRRPHNNGHQHTKD